jgi:multidrug efflux pump subunit AcrA (membrane-fusion protein)
MKKNNMLLFTILGFVYVCSIFSCGKAQASTQGYAPKVKVSAAEETLLADEVSGFGSLSFLTKVDIFASQEGTIRRIHYREGAFAPKGVKLAELANPQIELAVGRAENAHTQAVAALKLAHSRLMEGEFRAEAEILSIAKAQAEFAQAKKALEEQRRKAEDQETLYAAGGLSDEAIRDTRFSVSGAEEQLRLMERELEIRTVGLRDSDLRKAGLFPDAGFSSDAERRAALIRLSVSTLRAEAEAAQAQVEAAVKELESVRIARAELTIYNPAAGTVGARYLEEGERLKKEDKILTIIDSESLYVFFSLRESDALRLAKGMTAKVKVDGAGGVYDGTVDLVSPQADSQSFTFSVRVLLPREVVAAGGTIKPGMFARVTVRLGDERPVLTVPESAVVNRNGNEGTVFVISHGRASERKVSFGSLIGAVAITPAVSATGANAGVFYGDKREICSGLKAGETVAIKPEAYLREGSNVKPE